MSDVGSRMSDVSADVIKKRTFELGFRCVKLAEALPRSIVADVIGRQLIRSATSVASNYRASRRARSRAEFVAKLGIVEEECDETLLWLDYISRLKLVKPKRIQALQDEADEILSMAVSAIKTARKPKKSSSV